MEIRILRSFLEIAREGNMSRAAERLHISQSSLSKQMKDLEEELGKKLFRRGSYSMNLTEEGMILKSRAEDLLSLSDKIIDEFKSLGDITGGEVYIGAVESHLIKYLAKAVKNLKEGYPNIRYHIRSGDTETVSALLERGEVDIAFIVEPPDLSRYNYIEVPGVDIWGAVMKMDSPLANKKYITVDDIIKYPVFVSRQSLENDLPRWCGEKIDKLNVAATFSLSTNSQVFIKEDLGIALTFEHLIDISKESNLTFRPLSPPLENKMFIIWKKYQVFSRASDLLLKELEKVCSEQNYDL